MVLQLSAVLESRDYYYPRKQDADTSSDPFKIPAERATLL